ncbi:MAG: cytochrome c maturation protein CcmE, partial [Sphingomonadales bacterium]|nr:cytochrome c maturation protein CcmE [Sphingomonadales bacterium]
MKPKHQRLTLAVAALATVIGAGLLAVSALSDRAAYFYSPADLAKAKPAPDAPIRLGGMVADKSIVHEADGVTIRFDVEDG